MKGRPRHCKCGIDSIQLLPRLPNWIVLSIRNIIIITTRPKSASQDLGVKIQIKQVPFGVFSMSHFAPAALSSDLNQPGTINDDKNPPGIMKTRPGAIKTDLEQ